MRGVDEEDLSASCLGLIKLWAQFGLKKFKLKLTVCLPRNLSRLAVAHTGFCPNTAALTG